MSCQGAGEAPCTAHTVLSHLPRLTHFWDALLSQSWVYARRGHSQTLATDQKLALGNNPLQYSPGWAQNRCENPPVLKPSLPALLPPAEDLPCGVQTFDVLQHQGSQEQENCPSEPSAPNTVPPQPFQIIFCPLCSHLHRQLLSTICQAAQPLSAATTTLDPTQPRGAHSRYSLFMGWFRPCPFILTFSQGDWLAPWSWERS